MRKGVDNPSHMWYNKYIKRKEVMNYEWYLDG